MELENVENIARLKRSTLIKYMPLIEYLQYLGYEIPSRGNFKCPFHDDRTPSAKLFRDKDGMRVFCFTEQRQFSVVDAVLKLEEVSIDKYFTRIWKLLNDEQKENLMVTSGQEISYIPEQWPGLKVNLDKFRHGGISWEGFQIELLRVMEELESYG